jgi:hypothetical protein
VDARSANVVAIVSAWIVGGSITYTAADYGKWLRVFHDQLGHRLYWARTPGGAAPAGYVGLWLWGLGGGLITAAIVALLLRLRGWRPPSARLQGLCLAWAASTCLLAAAYFAWNNRP